ncbi:hypothetical protein RclHR1_01560013 [Rhizophagus clarus]|uniref:Uncharacterized protein n=1 Tax=Rhizophagus clarus TaxID=94130 RepID=A0A2Z6QFI9_9GLOM|nr:hypothetical protein RclHR1_01560013 [Rhizophagus clarus]
MKFYEFIEKESVNDEEKVKLKLLFEEFAFGWNSIMNYFVQDQKLNYNKFNNKQVMNFDLPIIYGLIEQKGAGVHLCAILEFLIKLHNEFLDSVIIAIPPKKYQCLKFLENISWDTLEYKTYFIKSIKVSQAQNINFINYNWNDKILKYKLYELIEEQVADSTINNIDNKFKTPLTQQMKDSINNVIDYYYYLDDQNKQLIPAKDFSLALKRFIYRFLLNDTGMKIHSNNLNVYFLNFTLDLWSSDIKEELIKKLFPTCLLVSHAYNTYYLIINEIEAIKKCNFVDIDYIP